MIEKLWQANDGLAS